MNSVYPILFFVAIATLLAVGMLVLGLMFGPKKTSPVKAMPYESGMDPIHDTRRRFDVRFHLVALAFLLFDVEILFLYPWAVAARTDHPVVAAKAAMETASPGGDTLSASMPAGGLNAAVQQGLVESRHLVFGGVMFFLLLVVAGFIYDWRKGIFRWR